MKLSLRKIFFNSLLIVGIGLFAGISAAAYFHYKAKVKQAPYQGKRVVVFIETGEVEGKEKEPAPANEENKPEENKQEAGEQKPVERQKEKKSEAISVADVKEQETQPLSPEQENKPEEKKEENPVTQDNENKNEQPKTEEKKEAPIDQLKEKPYHLEETKTPPDVENKPEAGGQKGHVEVPAAQENVSEKKAGQENKEDSIPSPSAKAMPKIAIIISGMGLSRSSTEDAIRMPDFITFSFSPYSGLLKEWYEKAKKSGHQVLIDLPLEPSDYPVSDPGPYALITSLGKDENIARLKNILSLAEGHMGVLTSRDEKFNAPKEEVLQLINEIKTRKMGIVFAGKSLKNKIPEVAEENNIPLVKVDLSIDEKVSREAIAEKLSELENIAKTNGIAVAVGKPYPVTVKMIMEWIRLKKEEGFEFVAISEATKGAKQ